MMTIHVYSNALVIEPGDDPKDMLAVKSLPGRTWSDEQNGWIVPITPGLTDRLLEIGVDIGGSIISDDETDFIESLKAQPITLTQAFEMPARDAVTLAVNEHLYNFHKGDLNDYARNHAPYRIGE